MARIDARSTSIEQGLEEAISRANVYMEPSRKKEKHIKSGSIQHQQKTLDPQQNLCSKVNKYVDLLGPGLPKQVVPRGFVVDRDPKKIVAENVAWWTIDVKMN